MKDIILFFISIDLLTMKWNLSFQISYLDWQHFSYLLTINVSLIYSLPPVSRILVTVITFRKSKASGDYLFIVIISISSVIYSFPSCTPRFQSFRACFQLHFCLKHTLTTFATQRNWIFVTEWMEIQYSRVLNNCVNTPIFSQKKSI